jgi:hypothetical protein
MLCVPRSCAASPCVIERTTVILSAIFAVSLQIFRKADAIHVSTDRPSGPRYSMGAERLRIERFLVRPSARHEDVDQRFRNLRRVDDAVRAAALGAQLEEVAQS